MEIFLPAEQAARASVGADARILLTSTPTRQSPPRSPRVPEAQFTPKHVETQSEREKLMFR
jgi:HlyD family secretion protein